MTMYVFLSIWFFLSVGGYVGILYYWLKAKPLKEKIAEAEAKIKLQEVQNELLKKELPVSRVERIDRLSALTGADK
jgi:cell division protein FtsL